MKLMAIPAEAWRAMAMNRLRSGLTMLGMIIGVGAVVLMLAIGQGAQATVSQSIATMGANLFIILSGSTTSGGLRMGGGTSPTLTLGDAEALASLPSLKGVAPVYSGNAQFAYGATNWSTLVYGVTPAYLTVRGWELESGSFFADGDVRGAARVVVLGRTVVDNLFGDEEPLGKTVRIRNAPYTVIGVLAPKGQSLDGRDQDDAALVPIRTAQNKIFGNPFPGTVRYIMAAATSPALMKTADAEMTRLLRQRHRIGEEQEPDFTIRDLTASARAAASSAQAMSFMLGAIASISLIVGGIGIMNIMLVSVTERTREIGIRMAIGARRRDILLQFLVEALFLCVVGGLLGAALGVLVAWLVAKFAAMTVVVTLSAVLLAFAFAAATGIFFGYYPARKAAAMRPVDALRHE